jgi:hypothetical protein
LQQESSGRERGRDILSRGSPNEAAEEEEWDGDDARTDSLEESDASIIQDTPSNYNYLNQRFDSTARANATSTLKVPPIRRKLRDE